MASVAKTECLVVVEIAIHSEVAGTVVTAGPWVLVLLPVVEGELPLPVERPRPMPLPMRENVPGPVAEGVDQVGAVDHGSWGPHLHLLEAAVLVDDRQLAVGELADAEAAVAGVEFQRLVGAGAGVVEEGEFLGGEVDGPGPVRVADAVAGLDLVFVLRGEGVTVPGPGTLDLLRW